MLPANIHFHVTNPGGMHAPCTARHTPEHGCYTVAVNVELETAKLALRQNTRLTRIFWTTFHATALGGKRRAIFELTKFV